MANNTVLVNNLCSWPLSFRRVAGQGDVWIPANAKNFPLLTEEEVQSQIQIGNRMFTGTDGMGNHARIQIVDENIRKRLFGFEDIEVEQPTILTEENVRALLAIRSKAKFKEKLNSMVKTDAEKRMLVDVAFKVGAEDAATWQVDALRKLADTAKL